MVNLLKAHESIHVRACAHFYGGKISLSVTGVSFNAKKIINTKSPTTWKFLTFFFCVTKCKVQKHKQRKTKRKTEKQPPLCGFLVLDLIELLVL